MFYAAKHTLEDEDDDVIVINDTSNSDEDTHEEEKINSENVFNIDETKENEVSRYIYLNIIY